ncbi:hypothetical protein, partial [Thiolapillus sp.]|uniref:hypothetical protein n=1 Tax=Thiolapillus sp. TaxID=2017437 RepID=UPI003AF816EF
MTRTAGAPIGCQRPSRFWGLGCPKIYHEAEDTLVKAMDTVSTCRMEETGSSCATMNCTTIRIPTFRSMPTRKA